VFYPLQTPRPVLLVAVGLAISLSGIPWVQARWEAERVAVAREDLETAARAMQRYRADTGVWPGAGQDAAGREWASLDFGLWIHDGHSGWSGPYLTQAPGLDPWGREYYLDGEPGGAPRGGRSVASAGPDGVFESWNRADTRAQGDDIVIWLPGPEFAAAPR